MNNPGQTPTPPVAPMLPAGAIIGGGGIFGDVVAGGSIGSITSAGTIAKKVTAVNTIGPIWSSGRVLDVVMSGAGDLMLTAWQGVLGAVTAQEDLDIRGGDVISGALTSIAGAIDAVSWGALSGAVNAQRSLYMWTLADIDETVDLISKTADLFVSTWGSVKAGTMKAVNASVEAGGDFLVDAIITHELFGVSLGDITVKSDFEGERFSQLAKGTVTIDEDADIKPTKGAYITAMGGFTGQIATHGPITITSLGKVKFRTGLLPSAVIIEADTVVPYGESGVTDIVGANVQINATDKINVGVQAVHTAGINSDNSVSGKIVAGEVAVRAIGSVLADIQGSRMVSVTTLAAVAGPVACTDGDVVIYAGGDVAGDVIAKGAVRLTAGGSVSSQIVSQAGWIRIVAGGLSGSSSVKGMGDVVITSFGNMDALVVAGRPVDGSTPPEGSDTGVASIHAMGRIGSTVDASGDVLIAATGNIQAAITAGHAASVQSNGTLSSKVTAATYADVVADTFITGAEIVVTNGGADVAAKSSIATAKVTAHEGVAVFAKEDILGGQYASTTKFVSVGAGSALSGVTATASLGDVIIYSGGAANITAVNGKRAFVSAHGAVSGNATPGDMLDILSFGSVTMTQASAGVHGVSVFAGGDVAGSYSSGGRLSVYAQGSVTGVYASASTTSVTTQADMANANINAGGAAYATVNTSISNSTIRGNNTWVLADSIVETTMSSTNAIEVVAVDGGISGSISSDRAATVFAKGTITAPITAGQVDATAKPGASAYVTTLADLEASVAARVDAVVSTFGDVKASVTAGRDVNVMTSMLDGSISAGRDAALFVAKNVTESVTADHDIIASVAGNIDAALTAQNDLSLFASAINASVAGDHVASVIASTVTGGGSIFGDYIDAVLFGDVTGMIAADTVADVVVGGNVAAAVGSGQDLSLSVGGNLTSSVGAVSGHAAVAVLGDMLDGTASAGSHIDLFVAGLMTGDVVSGGSAYVSSAGVMTHNTITAAGEIDALSLGGIDQVWVGGNDVSVASLAGITDSVIEAADSATAMVSGAAAGMTVTATRASAIVFGDLVTSTITGMDTSLVGFGDVLSTHLEATNIADAFIVGSVGNVTFSGANGLDVSVVGNIDSGTFESDSGVAGVLVTGSGVFNMSAAEAFVFGGGPLNAIVAAAGDITAIGLTYLAGALYGNRVEAFAGADLTAHVSGSGLLLVAAGDVSGTISASGHARLIAFGDLSPVSVSANNLTAVAFGNITSTYAIADNVYAAHAAGSLGGTFTVGGSAYSLYGGSMLLATVDVAESIHRVVTGGLLAGNLTAGESIDSVRANGAITGSITVSPSAPSGAIGSVVALGDFSGSIAAPDAINWLYVGGSITGVADAPSVGWAGAHDELMVSPIAGPSFPTTIDLIQALTNANVALTQLIDAVAVMGDAMSASLAESLVAAQEGVAGSIAAFQAAMAAGAEAYNKAQSDLGEQFTKQANASQGALTRYGKDRDDAYAAAAAAYSQMKTAAEQQLAESRKKLDEAAKGIDRDIQLDQETISDINLARDEMIRLEKARYDKEMEGLDALWKKHATVHVKAELAHHWEEFQKNLEIAQVILDIAGTIDPTPISDIIGGIVALLRGQPGEALISLVSVIPYIGDTAKLGKNYRRAERIYDGVDATADAARAAHRASDAATTGTRTAARAKKSFGNGLHDISTKGCYCFLGDNDVLSGPREMFTVAVGPQMSELGAARADDADRWNGIGIVASALLGVATAGYWAYGSRRRRKMKLVPVDDMGLPPRRRLVFEELFYGNSTPRLVDVGL